jgi:hypothetical protein
LVGCAHHVQLVAADSSPGASYVCSSERCTAATTIDPAQSNRARTKHYTLPRECGGRVHQILVIDTRSDEPWVSVTCAAREEPIGEMR